MLGPSPQQQPFSTELLISREWEGEGGGSHVNSVCFVQSSAFSTASLPQRMSFQGLGGERCVFFVAFSPFLFQHPFRALTGAWSCRSPALPGPEAPSLVPHSLTAGSRPHFPGSACFPAGGQQSCWARVGRPQEEGAGEGAGDTFPSLQTVGWRGRVTHSFPCKPWYQTQVRLLPA